MTPGSGPSRATGGRPPGIRMLAPVALGTVMVVCAQVTSERGMVFPEAVALAFGTWVMGRPDWCESRPRLVLAPVLSAALGLVASDLISVRVLAEVAALSCAMVVLLALPSRVAPSLSAAVLPAVFAVRTWVYPVSVLVLAAVVLAGAQMRAKRSGRRDPGRRPGPDGGRGPEGGRGPDGQRDPGRRPGPDGRRGPDTGTGWWAGARRWPLPSAGAVYLISAVWLVIAAAAGLPTVASAPPLLVSGVEWIMEGRPGPLTGVRRGVALVAAWTAGSVAVWWIQPAALAGALALTFAVALVWGWNVKHAPVLAMSLVAQIAGPPSSWAEVARNAWGVGLAVAVLYVAGSAALWMRGQDPGDREGERSVARDAGTRPSS